ncbi:LacI family DNA-binding transcriptional regulator [Paenibacillus sp. FA6]|uniref:LacI family DNA-binding transcriptional regulator n=1 Tax=Paenibacillus sp. FA6 TaxID=3413029 RepID=UPI003F656CB5
MKNTEINSTEIARLAGVSRSTVSRVINNYPNVPTKTREKVMQVIEKYQYVPNLSAQIMAGKRTRTIGLFLKSTGLVSNDMLTNMLITRVIESASLRGYYVLTHIMRTKTDEEEARIVKETFQQRRIDGGIFIGAANHEPLIEELIGEGYLVGIVDQNSLGRTESNRIVSNFDNITGMRLGVDYLVSMNHRKIAFIKGDPLRWSGPEKYEGFMQAMAAHYLPVNGEWIIPGDFSEEGGYRATKEWLGTVSELPTAIFSVNDSVAFGALRALNEAGIQVPEQISLLGFDDHVLSSRINPALTTIHVDFYEMMENLTDAMIQSIEKGPQQFQKFIAKTSLVVRDSCRAI